MHLNLSTGMRLCFGYNFDYVHVPVSYFITFADLIYTSFTEWKDLKSIEKRRMHVFSFSTSTSTSAESHWALYPEPRIWKWWWCWECSFMYFIIPTTSTCACVSAFFLGSYKKKEPSGKPRLVDAVGKHGHTIIYLIWLAAKVWASPEALSSPGEYDVCGQWTECVCSSDTQGFQTPGREPFVGNKNLESVVTSIYRNEH